MKKKIDKDFTYVFQSDFDRVFLPEQQTLDFSDSFIEDLLKNIKIYIKKVESNDYKVVSAQRGKALSAEDTNLFFRSLERHQNNVLMLQYLISFLDKLPLSDDISADPADPFHQFKKFILFNLELLNEPDVLDSIFKELRDQGILKPDNIGQCRMWVKGKYEEVSDMVQHAHKAVKEDWVKLFSTLKWITTFWFSVKKHDPDKIRKVDKFHYFLALILIRKYG